MIPTRQQAEQQGAKGDDADLPVWDLSDLYQRMDDPAIERDLAAASDGADELIKEGQGKLAGMDGKALAAFIQRYEKIEDAIGRVYSFASLLNAAKSDDPEIGRFFQTVRERINDIGTKLLFVTLEINKIDDADLKAKAASDDGLAHYQPWLRDIRSFRPHQLDDEIERVLHEKSITGRAAWNRLFDETMARIRFPLDGEELTSAEIFDRLSDKDRAKREVAAKTIASTLEGNINLFALITNTLAKDKQIEDGWRKFERPISSRNLANQVEDGVVDALISATKDAYPRLAHRYYQYKAKWMGLDKLQYWDRNAPLPEDSDKRIAWDDAKVIVLDAYRGFSPKLADIVDRFFTDRWIDAPPPRQRRRRFLSPDGAERASLCAHELPGSPARCHDARPRTRPRRPPGSRRQARSPHGRYPVNSGRDGLGLWGAVDVSVGVEGGD